jgi:hypothetical protein
MSKGMYIGISSKARKIHGMYIGMNYEDSDTTLIKTNNITKFFTETNGSYYFSAAEDGSIYSNNYNISSSTATTTFTALYDMNISFDYSVSSETNYDKFTIKVGSKTVANAISGEKSGSWSGSIAKGQTIILTYSKDGSNNTGSDRA